MLLSDFIVHNREGSEQLVDSDLPKHIEFWYESTGVAYNSVPPAANNLPIEVVRIELSKVSDLPSPCLFLYRRYELTVEGIEQK